MQRSSIQVPKPLTMVLIALLAGVGVVLAVIYSQNVVLTGQNAALSKDNADLDKNIRLLADYEAPVFVWDKTVLQPGETESPILKQTPIRLPDGHMEDTKAVVMERGNWNNEQFVQDPHGNWFRLSLFVKGDPDVITVGPLLTDPGLRTATKCSGRESHFNCYFVVTLVPNDSIKVLWTMFHHMNDVKVANNGHTQGDEHIQGM
jgi:hypothetical protein